MVFLFAPLVGLLLGVASITVPWSTLLLSVALYIVIPVIIAQAWRRSLLNRGAEALAEAQRKLRPASLVALLTTLVLLFGFQGQQIIAQPTVIMLLAVPILIQVYFNSALAYWLSRKFGVAWCVAAPPRWLRQQFLRTGGCRSYQPLRTEFRRCTRHRRRSAGRSSRHALGGQDREGDARLV